jgi:soluble lytic murein transglycosylase
MQLIPSTAKMVARLTNDNFTNIRELLNADKNIRFGSKYLRMMLNKYRQNSVLAAAAYNAGPARIQQWLPKYDLPSDVWIESIPFRETRNYVKNILTYTVIYQQLLGNTPTLTKHMPLIQGTERLVRLSTIDTQN